MEANLTFSVVTWNILADAYIKTGRYDHVPPWALEPPRRRALLLQQIRELDCDLYCLQEVEPGAFSDIEAELSASHDGLYEQKRGKPDGSAIFFRRSALSLERHTSLHFRATEPGYDHLALVAFLRAKGGQRLALVSTHLRFSSEPRERHLGAAQMSEILELRRRELPQWPCWLVCGDMNSTSDGPPIALAREAGLDLSCRSQRPWDTVNINGRRRKLDYLLMTPGALSPAPRPLPALQRDTPMPSGLYPSDHLPLAVDYRWVT